MTREFVFGAALAFAAAVQPGPFQAFLISRTMARGWRGAWPAAFAPLLSDGPIIVLVMLVLTAVPPVLTPILRIAGGGFLLFLAHGAWTAWRRPRPTSGGQAGQRTLLQAVTVNILNPNPYLSWSLVMGPALKEAWAVAPAHGAALLAGFYGTFVVCLLGFIGLFAWARGLGPAIARGALLVSVAALAAFGVYQIVGGLSGLT